MTETKYINAAMLAERLNVSRSRVTQILDLMESAGKPVGSYIGRMRVFDPAEVAEVEKFPRRHYRKS